MPKLHVNLTHVRAVRALRNGFPLDAVCHEFRLNESALATLLQRFVSVPDELLHDLERHMESNERLRRVVTRLASRQRPNDLRPIAALPIAVGER